MRKYFESKPVVSRLKLFLFLALVVILFNTAELFVHFMKKAYCDCRNICELF